MSKALLRYIRLSPTKARLIAREIQGMNAELAIASLEFTPNKAARVISKVIASAVANGSYEAQSVSILSCRVDAGPVLRRFRPRAKGRATPIRKPTSHILVEVGTQKIAKQDKTSKEAKISKKDDVSSKESVKKTVKTTQKKTTQTSKKTKGEDK
ncbi:50S ribosomal protein L22 [Helicobacter sp. 13S00482-2]|uniref:50S ribosomal protein L22 n=1 Tax=Helicobacter sp. 13S00482-2 TaxID=1476200 RepID=UPI000BA6B240|nr:50S ribosomal protein L22 [Helicobacter sp. 13S00482-2]PAF54310.1 50S ribosomal protein L22 [Helicobacter sp. 13S00482-2]